MANKETFNEVGIGAREDLGSFVTLVSRGNDENVVINRIGAAKRATARKHEYLADSIRSAKVNKFKENYDVQSDVVPNQTTRVRLDNEVQTMAEAFEINDSVMSQDLAGVVSEISYQRNIKTMIMANDKEFGVITSVKVVGLSGTAGEADGLLNITDNTNIRGVAMTDDTVELRAPQLHDAAAAPIDLDHIDEMTKNARKNGKRLRTILMPFDQAQNFANKFQQFREIQAAGTDFTNALFIYRNAFGQVEIIPHIYMPAQTIFGYNPEMLKESVFKSFRTYTTGKVGPLTTFVIDEETTFEHRQPDTYQKTINLS